MSTSVSSAQRRARVRLSAWARRQRACVRAEQSLASTRAALEQLLALHPRSAFVVDERGDATPMNEHARRDLESDGAALRERLAVAARSPHDAGYDAITVRLDEKTARTILVERASFEHRIAAVAQRWGLTERQGEVLESAVRGLSNKEIAQALVCAEVTVESHLTAIYRKSGVHGRSRLVAEILAA